MLWAKDLQGRVPQIGLDLFAKQYALEMVMLLTHIDERLDEEKQKLSALDFDDLELRVIELLDAPGSCDASCRTLQVFSGRRVPGYEQFAEARLLGTPGFTNISSVKPQTYSLLVTVSSRSTVFAVRM